MNREPLHFLWEDRVVDPPQPHCGCPRCNLRNRELDLAAKIMAELLFPEQALHKWRSSEGRTR